MRKPKLFEVGFTVFAGSLLVPLFIQAQTAPFDQAAMRRELAVMESILTTSLNAVDVGTGAERHGRFGAELSRTGRVQGVYLYGQGALFTIQVPWLPDLPLERLARMEHDLQLSLERSLKPELLESQYLMALAQLENLRTHLEIEPAGSWAGLAEDLEALATPPPPPPPPPPAAPAPPAPPAPPDQRDVQARQAERAERAEQMRRRIREMQGRLTEMRTDAAERNRRRAETRERIEADLREVIARYGDSLTLLQPEERLTFILRSSPSFGFEPDSEGSRNTVLTVRKADLTAYRSGSISRETLDGRIVRYDQP